MTTVNVDPAEIEKFSSLAHRWWDPNSEFRPLHEINPLRLDWINGLSSLKDRQVLDVGCGGGILTEAMAKMGARTLGIDLADKSLKVAKIHALQEQVPNLNYELISVEELATKASGQYDVVTCMEMLEHVPNPQSVISACAQLVKPNGWVYFSTINRNFKAFLFAILGAEYVLNLLPKGTHEYEKFIRPSELAGMARQAGLELQMSQGLQYNPITRRYWLSQDVSVNYLMAMRRAGTCA